jgi:TATA-box binding protein (TBP) (component of TFIID and TFIIIB)
MENLRIKPTKNTPFIDFYVSGKLVMSGSAYSENADEYFRPVIDWIKALQAEEVNAIMTLEYMNTSSAKKILILLQNLELNQAVKTIKINWQYEKGDDDILETGQILEESLKRTKFEFTVYEKERKIHPLR